MNNKNIESFKIGLQSECDTTPWGYECPRCEPVIGGGAVEVLAENGSVVHVGQHTKCCSECDYDNANALYRQERSQLHRDSGGLGVNTHICWYGYCTAEEYAQEAQLAADAGAPVSSEVDAWDEQNYIEEQSRQGMPRFTGVGLLGLDQETASDRVMQGVEEIYCNHRLDPDGGVNLRGSLYCHDVLQAQSGVGAGERLQSTCPDEYIACIDDTECNSILRRILDENAIVSFWSISAYEATIAAMLKQGVTEDADGEPLLPCHTNELCDALTTCHIDVTTLGVDDETILRIIAITFVILLMIVILLIIITGIVFVAVPS